jgi:hypothetical protein
MARHKVVHSDDGCTIVIDGDRRDPEPAYAIIRFPGGHVEVTRCSDGRGYWAHLSINPPRRAIPRDDPAGLVTESRVDFHQDAARRDIPELTAAADVEHIALRIEIAP